MPADLSQDTAVAPIPEAPGWYAATLPDSWSWRLPAGGVLMTVGLRAMQAALDDPGLKLVSANTLFCSPVAAGPVEIRVDILRRGNATAQVRASLRAPPSRGPDLEVSATFARDREILDVIDAAPPSVPQPADAPPYVEPMRGGGTYPFLENFESRLALGNRWWQAGWEPGPARFARWIRYLMPQRLAGGALDPLAIPPIADLMPTSLSQKVGPAGPRFYAPSLDLTVHFLDPTESEWLLVNTYARRARAGVATAEVEIWGEDGRLAAYGTQTMMLRKPSR
ncbi:MAG TPA: thioesterase family protein [Candidatus Nanopelagicales bacterium]|nr:thioesterase family protein [Candidatus Nanopelagicales bacterium]